jgi:hypothetical protein
MQDTQNFQLWDFLKEKLESKGTEHVPSIDKPRNHFLLTRIRLLTCLIILISETC